MKIYLIISTKLEFKLHPANGHLLIYKDILKNKWMTYLQHSSSEPLCFFGTIPDAKLFCDVYFLD